MFEIAVLPNPNFRCKKLNPNFRIFSSQETLPNAILIVISCNLYLYTNKPELKRVLYRYITLLGLLLISQLTVVFCQSERSIFFTENKGQWEKAHGPYEEGWIDQLNLQPPYGYFQ